MLEIRKNYAASLRSEIEKEIESASPRKNIDITFVEEADIQKAAMIVANLFPILALFITSTTSCIATHDEIKRIIAKLSYDEVVCFISITSGGGVTIDREVGCISVTAWGAFEDVIETLSICYPGNSEVYNGN